MESCPRGRCSTAASVVLGDTDGRVAKVKGSKPGAAVLARELPVSAVWRWP
ncbi:hypothetical protein [Archangium lipolyticum]|uniref:hypothetical protein n=1 Tax=Archangium lipolyticum TaxID=2970465 RepID=UPI00214A825B|nr:hypothetical protein [Archangium lipolyticum]